MKRRTALLLCLAPLITAIAVSPISRIFLGIRVGFMPALFAAILLTELITGYLLWQKFLARGEIALLGLSLTYLFTGLLLIPNAFTSPIGLHITGALGGTSSTAAWFWIFWHLAFPLGLALSLAPWPERVVRYVGANHIRVGRLGVAAVILTTVLISLLLSKGLGTVPGLGGVLTFPRMTRTFGPFVVILGLLALAVVVKRSQSGRRLERWIVIAAAASSADAILTVGGQGRFTVGWYAGRGLALAATGVVLIALVREIGRIYRETLISNRQLRELNEKDALTGVFSRSAILEQADELISAPGRLSIAVLDLDNFKEINDSHGHSVGDEVLVWVAARMADCLRAGDAVGRLGGEEFVILFPGAGSETATRAGERIRRAISDSTIATAAGLVRITASVGIATRHPDDRISSTLLGRADQQMYAAKAAGRNQVMSSEKVRVLVRPSAV